MSIRIQEWWSQPLSAATEWVQLALWGFLLLVFLWWVVEQIHRRRQVRGGGASLVALPGGRVRPGTRQELNGAQVPVDGALELDSCCVRAEPGPSVLVGPGLTGYRVTVPPGAPAALLNGRPVGRGAVMHDGDVLKLGDDSFRFEWTEVSGEHMEVRNWFLLPAASLFFLFIQWAAWHAAGDGRPDPAVMLQWSLVLLGAFWVAEILVRKARGHVDPVLLPVTLVLLGLGFAVLLRTGPDLYERQAIAGAIGAGALVVTAVAPLQRLSQFRFLSLVGAILLLLLTVLLGQRIGDQRLAVSFFGLQFQPAEPAKLLIAVFLAGLLSERQELVARSGRGWSLTRADFRYLGPVALAWAAAMGLLIVQRDLGTALLFFGLFVAFLGMASGRAVFVMLSLGAFVCCAILSAAAFDRVRERMDLWLNPWQDPHGLGYQLSQGLFALGAGGVRGVGLGEGFPRLVPAAHTDLPLTILGEELGLIGSLGALALYLVLALRGYRAARRSEDQFLGLLAAGLTTALALQTIVIVGGVVRMLPLTGVTLPFISFGGASLVVNLILVGMLLAVSARPSNSVAEREERPDQYSWKANLPWAKGAVCAALVTLGGFLVYWQFVQSPELSAHPNNTRLLVLEPRLNRGRILALGGEPLALSEAAAVPGAKERVFTRRYPEGDLVGNIVGYTSRRRGRTGIEGEANTALLGVREGSAIADAVKRAQQGAPGHNVRLTLDLKLQEAAAEALGRRRGSVVAVDPRTGAVRAMVSRPRAALENVDEQWEELNKDREQPLVFRATQGVYPPGSTFKVVTAVVALDAGVVTPETRFYCPGAASIGNYTWRCFGGKSHGHLTFADALRVSCNVTFGQVGQKLGRDRLKEGARRLGIGEAAPMELATARGLLDPHSEPWGSIPVQLGFGQGPLAVTPLQMALVAAGVANDGVIMEPHLLRDHETPEGQQIWQREPRPWKQAMKPQTASQVRAMMAEVVRAGTGGAAQLPNVTVGGKTGTAENPHGDDHAWFISLAPVEQPTLAVAVIVEGGGQGGRVAAPIARDVLAAHLGVKEEDTQVARR